MNYHLESILTAAWIVETNDVHGYALILVYRNSPITKVKIHGFNSHMHAIRWIEDYCAPGTPIYYT